MSFVAHKEGRFSLRCLFGVVLGLFQPALSCYIFFRVVLLFTINDFTEVNPPKANFMLDFVSKWGKCYYKVGQLFSVAKHSEWN